MGQRLPKLRRLCLDASGIGLQPAESLHDRHGRRVEPVTLSLPLKANLAARMLRVFQRDEVSIIASRGRRRLFGPNSAAVVEP